MDKTHNWFICKECIFVFQTFSRFKTKKVYCPSCSESKYVETYEGLNKQTKHKYWTENELVVLKRCMKKKLMPHQIAILLGRSSGSVREKMRRLEVGN